MGILDFMHEHWFLAFLMICFAYGLLVRIVRLPTLLLRGYPPEWCDVDGDLKRKADNT